VAVGAQLVAATLQTLVNVGLAGEQALRDLLGREPAQQLERQHQLRLPRHGRQATDEQHAQLVARDVAPQSGIDGGVSGVGDVAQTVDVAATFS